nr:hypothetical protein [Candidatus Sigynarchaeum springense]
MLNIKDLLEQKKKLGIFLAFSLIGLVTLGISLIPSMNYLTGENMSEQAGFLIPAVYIVLYALLAAGVLVSLFLLSVISKKLYVVKNIDDSIKGIKKGRSFMTGKVLPKREELMQAHYAEQIKEAGMPAGRLKIFDGMSQAEHDEIVGFKIEKDLGTEP